MCRGAPRPVETDRGAVNGVDDHDAVPDLAGELGCDHGRAQRRSRGTAQDEHLNTPNRRSSPATDLRSPPAHHRPQHLGNFADRHWGISAIRSTPWRAGGRGGLLITTSTFTREARQEASRDGAPPIELISGQDLPELLRKYEIGGTTKERVVQDVSVDLATFD